MQFPQSGDGHGSAHLRHNDVADDEGNGFFESLCELHGDVAATCIQDLVAALKKKLTGDFSKAVFVLKEQDSLRALGICTLDKGSDDRINLRIHAGKVKVKGCSNSGFTRDPDIASALLHHSIDRSQSKSCAATLFLCGEEWFENTSPDFLRHSHPVIAHRERSE